MARLDERMLHTVSTVELGTSIRAALAQNGVDGGELLRGMNSNPEVTRQVVQLLLVEKLTARRPRENTG